MSEHLRALVVILAFATTVFVFAKPQACFKAMAVKDFERRRNLWLIITLAAFFTHNFWLFTLVSGVVLLLSLPRENNKFALFFFLMMALPPIGDAIWGFGLFTHLFKLHYIRLLSLVILLPVFLELRKHNKTLNAKSISADKTLLGYLILAFILQLWVDTLTNSLRYAFYAFLDVWLVYYVASRTLSKLEDFRDALMAFAVAALIVAAVGIFESGKHWLLYSSLPGALGLEWDLGGYLLRGDDLRAVATTGQAIALGYAMVVAAAIFLYLRTAAASTRGWNLGMLLLIGGLLAPVSRGPWVGGAVGLLLFLAMGPKPVLTIGKLGLLGLVVFVPLLLSPLGPSIIDRLPFVGTVDSENVLYRQRLLELSLDIIERNPFFGSYDFMNYLQELKQGSGLIDLVNSYIAIALSSGLVGLSLFVSTFLISLHGIYRGMAGLSKDSEEHRLGRFLIGTLIAIMVMIFTVSSITIIPYIYWAFVGMGIAYARMMSASRAPAKEQPVLASQRFDGSLLGSAMR